MNQTFRRPDSGSAAMSIIGQEREGRESIREKSATWTDGGGGPSFATRVFCGEGRRGTSVSLVHKHLVILIRWSENSHPSQ